jgi:hypothetical protein
MKKYPLVYQANTLDYEATINRARKLGVKVELGGGRRTKGGESPNAQIILNLKDLYSKIVISRTGKVEIYYPSRPILKKCLQILEQCYVPEHGPFCLECEGPVDPLDQAFEYTITVNWKGTELVCAKAEVDVHQWLDLTTREYIFRLPDREGRVIWPEGNYVYQGYCPVKIIAVDKDDEHGNRVVTAEKLRWKMIQELRRIAREHPRLKSE